MTNQNNQVDWKEKLNTILWDNMDLGSINNPERPMRASLQTDLVDFIEQTIHQETEKAVREVTNKIKKHKFNFFKADTALFDGNVKLSTVNQKNVIECEELITFLDSLQPTNNTKEE